MTNDRCLGKRFVIGFMTVDLLIVIKPSSFNSAVFFIQTKNIYLQIENKCCLNLKLICFGFGRITQFLSLK